MHNGKIRVADMEPKCLERRKYYAARHLSFLLVMVTPWQSQVSVVRQVGQLIDWGQDHQGQREREVFKLLLTTLRGF